VAEFLEQLQQATIDADAFFDEPLYVVSITDWPSGEALLKASDSLGLGSDFALVSRSGR
jgi:hypothetical protein